MADEKTEAPTPKKLKDAFEQGQVARSQDLAMAAATLAAVMALGRFGGGLVSGLASRMSSDLSHLGDHVTRNVTSGELTGLVLGAMGLTAILVAPVAMATMVTGLFVQGVQGGWAWAPSKLQPNFAGLSPANGITRLGSPRAILDTLKTFVSVAVIGYIAWGTVEAIVNDGVRLAWMSPMAGATMAWSHAQSLLWKIAWALAFLAIADYGLQRYRHISGLKMTKQEVRSESKSNDGSPEVKGKMKRIQRDMARRRMIGDVAKATVVITNPTHFAVALEYKRGSMAAPLVLAKGADHLAAAIREQAKKHGIPMVENKPLAQALFKTAEVGETIPANLFAAVAEVLAQLIRLKQLIL